MFGERGIEATSLREVAKAAGVSPALVVHHFGGKDGLVSAVDEKALIEFGAAYGTDAVGGDDTSDLLRRRSEQTVRVMREHPEACAYLGRALVEGTDGSARLFRLMIAGGRAEIEALAKQGALREDADRLEREALDGPLLDKKILDRWAAANVDLLREGLYR